MSVGDAHGSAAQRLDLGGDRAHRFLAPCGERHVGPARASSSAIARPMPGPDPRHDRDAPLEQPCRVDHTPLPSAERRDADAPTPCSA